MNIIEIKLPKELQIKDYSYEISESISQIDISPITDYASHAYDIVADITASAYSKSYDATKDTFSMINSYTRQSGSAILRVIQDVWRKIYGISEWAWLKFYSASKFLYSKLFGSSTDHKQWSSLSSTSKSSWHRIYEASLSTGGRFYDFTKQSFSKLYGFSKNQFSALIELSRLGFRKVNEATKSGFLGLQQASLWTYHKIQSGVNYPLLKLKSLSQNNQSSSSLAESKVKITTQQGPVFLQKKDKKWYYIGCAILLAGLIGYYWLNSESKIPVTAGSVVDPFLRKVKNEMSKKNHGQNALNEIEKSFNRESVKYIYQQQLKQIKATIYNASNISQDIGQRAFQLFFEAIAKACSLIDSGKKQQGNVALQIIFNVIEKSIKEANEHHCPLIKQAVENVFTLDIPVSRENFTEVSTNGLELLVKVSPKLQPSTIRQYIAQCHKLGGDCAQKLLNVVANNFEIIMLECEPESQQIFIDLLSDLNEDQLNNLFSSNAAILIVKAFCRLIQQQTQQLLLVKSTIFKEYPLIERINNHAAKNRIAIKELSTIYLETLSFSETAATTTLQSTTNIINLVTWTQKHFLEIMTRNKCSQLISSLQKQIIQSLGEKSEIDGVGSVFLDQLRWMHSIRLEDKQKGFEQLNINLPLTTLLPHLLLRFQKSLPTKFTLKKSYQSTFPFESEKEGELVAKSITQLVNNYLFVKEIFISMLEKTSSHSESDITTFTNFYHSFYTPSSLVSQINNH